MSGSINKVILIGNLGKDPVVKDSQYGKLVNFSLATSESWKDKKTGEKKSLSQWHNVVIKNNDGLAGIAEKYLKKGSKVFIQGKLETRKYTKDGADVYVTEIIVGAYGGEITLLGNPSNGDEKRDNGYEGQEKGENNAPHDDDIPF
jgi:single-strand DNA-binding protein